ncbi:hypothetical protein E5Q_03990 [Mixia osmundae IAM 14324]|uniref:phosphatidate phosphatase n=1 Tax=Mixia osmundae (strain CBS 9802 / IAM 14324 / JCM 22182 / KY 12970) TaxID=764103 RepID=G7E3A2_MIXOS|nr:hypothetical protein E5Q_03990 [Mixia osmundae IAM 14324]
MQYIGRAFSTAAQYYKEINPATLSGAIDIVVVQRPAEKAALLQPGASGSSSVSGPSSSTRHAADDGYELACSPFHVRFGKLSVLRPVDRKVRVIVNDEEVPFFMKVGDQGEAFFVFETDADVPEDLQTSPLTGPVTDDQILAQQHEPESDYERYMRQSSEPLDTSMTPTRTTGRRTDQTLPTTVEGDVDFLDLNESASPDRTRAQSEPPLELAEPAPAALGSEPSQSNRKVTAFAEDQPFHSEEKQAAAEADEPKADNDQSRLSKLAEGPSTLLSNTAAKASELGKAMLSTAGESKKLDTLVKDRLRHAPSSSRGNSGTATPDSHDKLASDDPSWEPGISELEKEMKNDLTGHTNATSADRSGDQVRQADRQGNADSAERDYHQPPNDQQRSMSVESSESEIASKLERSHISTGPHEAETDMQAGPGPEVGVAPTMAASGSLMLDMSGYKVGDKDIEKVRETENDLLSDQMGFHESKAFQTEARDHLMSFTRSLLRSADMMKMTDGGANYKPQVEEAGKSSETLLPGDNLDLERGRSPPATPRSIESADGTSSPRATSPDGGTDALTPIYSPTSYQFALRADETVHVFELALCGGDTFGNDATLDDRTFAEHRVTFEQFLEQPELTSHRALVIKYDGVYLTWEDASPVLASLTIYRKSLGEHAKTTLAERRARETDGRRDSTSRAPRAWRRWWKGSRADDDALSPPTSPPARPVSPGSVPSRGESPGYQTEATSLPETASDKTGEVPVLDRKKHYAKTLRLTSDQLKQLKLRKGVNTVSFSVQSSYSGLAVCSARIFLWEHDFQVCISDIDGTITKSDALGHVFTMIGRDWTHLGVAKLYTDIARNGYKLLYLTSRAIGQANTTRDYLKGIQQNGFQLPEGPVIMSPDRLMTSLHREVIIRKPEVFKMACLRDIQRLFGERTPFYAGFGNRITDALSYRSVDVPSSRIFTIDPNGDVKMELLALAGYKSSYIAMTDLVDQMFPPINRKAAPEFTDFNFWRPPMAQIALPDFSPPSPALSARSDSSRLSFARLGSLSLRKSSISSPTQGGDGKRVRPSSPLMQPVLYDDPEEMEPHFGTPARNHRRADSMPGSFEELEGGFDYHRAQQGRRAVSSDDTSADAHSGDEAETEQDLEAGPDEEDDFLTSGDMDFSAIPYL